MDTEKATLVICGSLILVAVINFAIYTIAKRRKGTVGEFELFRRAMKRSRDPWGEENANLETLAAQIAELQKKENNQDDTDD